MKVLIGITTHNRASILPKAIQSALDQDYPHKEVAVFNDASTDETWKLSEKFPQVRWLHAEKNQGYVLARNRLMQETDAAFYFSLDDDAWFIQGDEISQGVNLLKQQSRVAAIAYDILSPDRPNPTQRAKPYPTHIFIGCGHLLRLSAVKEGGFYTPSPGFYGSEEKDLCVRLLNQGYEVIFLPGVHVWHDKTLIARDSSAQYRSGVCNDLVFAFRRCPYPMVLWLLPAKMLSHLRFSITHNLITPGIRGMVVFLRAIPRLGPSREPVSRWAFKEFLRRSRERHGVIKS
jgi:GT2 family glycosyltransferase